MNEQEVITRLENFRDRYKEWAEKDDSDINIQAINAAITKMKSLEPKVCNTCKNGRYYVGVDFKACPKCGKMPDEYLKGNK